MTIFHYKQKKKMKKLPVSLLLLLFLLSFSSCTKKVVNPKLVINEVLVVNENNFVDDYGQRSAWIEIFNNTGSTQNVGGYFLTNDKSNTKKYPIPRGDVLTKILPQQHALFWADNTPTKGTFHLNFTLDTSKENWIGLYDESGLVLIDEIVIPGGQVPDVSYGYEKDGVKYAKDGSILLANLAKVTPSTNNYTLDKNEKVEKFLEIDPIGVSMTLTAMLIVFSALVMLFLVFKLIGNISVSISRSRNKGKAVVKESETGSTIISGEVLTAIFMALHEEQDQEHDIESTFLTFNKVNKTYSPWSSKIYGLREIPRK